MVWLWTTQKSRIRAVEEEFPGSDQQGVLNTSGWHSSEPKDAAAEGSSGWHPRGGGVDRGALQCHLPGGCPALSRVFSAELFTVWFIVLFGAPLNEDNPCQHGSLIVASGLFTPSSL